MAPSLPYRFPLAELDAPMPAELRRSEDKVLELRSKLEHYERVEVALQEALQTARDNSAQALKKKF